MMLGLIKKDLFMIKGNLKTIGIIFIIFIGMGIFQNMNLAFIPGFISVVLFMSTFSYDEYNKWDSYAVTLPNGRKNVVSAKYITTLILLLISIVIAATLSIVVGIVRNTLSIEEIVGIMGGSTLAIILLVSIVYPIIFKFGNEKGRIAMFVIAFLGTSLIALIFKTIKISKDIILFMEQYGIIVLTIVSLIMLLTSYLLSKKIYAKKEF